MMFSRESIRESIRWARGVHRDLSEREALRAYSRGHYDDLAEAMAAVPRADDVNESDVDAAIDAWADEARRLRAYAEPQRGKWAPHVVERWIVRAEELEDRVARLRAEAA